MLHWAHLVSWPRCLSTSLSWSATVLLTVPSSGQHRYMNTIVFVRLRVFVVCMSITLINNLQSQNRAKRWEWTCLTIYIVLFWIRTCKMLNFLVSMTETKYKTHVERVIVQLEIWFYLYFYRKCSRAEHLYKSCPGNKRLFGTIMQTAAFCILSHDLCVILLQRSTLISMMLSALTLTCYCVWAHERLWSWPWRWILFHWWEPVCFLASLDTVAYISSSFFLYRPNNLYSWMYN